MEVIVKKIGGKLVAEIPSEALQQLGAAEGETLVIAGDANALSVQRARNERIHRVLDEDCGVLEELAKSERMDRVKAIMDRYDNALHELAK